MNTPAQLESQAFTQTHKSLEEKLKSVVKNLPAEHVTLKEIIDIVGNDSLMFLTIFLALVFLVPVSIPGVSTVFGSAILIIGIARLFNKPIWLPKKGGDRKIATVKLAGVIEKALVWFKRLETFSKPYRLAWMTKNSKADMMNKISYILAALLLMVPFGFVPFSNTLPALALILLAVGAIQKDGTLVLLGHVTNLATILYFSILVAGGGAAVFELSKYLTA